MSFYHSESLREFVSALFQSAGVGPQEADCVAESLVDSNLRGHDSHGVVRVAGYLDQLRIGQLVAGAEFQVLRETPSLLVGDGGRGFGQVHCRTLVDRVSMMARTAGVACGTLRNCGHVGRLGEWVERAANSGIAALISVNDNGVPRCVAPPGGIEGRISTNPLAIGVPTTDGPFVLDISTSVVANGKVTVARLAGEQVPAGWLQDATGQPTTDPHVMQADPPGTLLPFGGTEAYKGFGLGLILDILVGGLSGGFCPPAPAGVLECNNVLFVAWDPAQGAGMSHFTAEADKLIQAVRGTPRKPGVPSIQLPGDRSSATHRERLEAGIPLEGGTWDSLVTVAARLNVALPIALSS